MKKIFKSNENEKYFLINFLGTRSILMIFAVVYASVAFCEQKSDSLKHNGEQMQVWRSESYNGDEYPGVSIGYPSCVNVDVVALTMKQPSDHNMFDFRPSLGCAGDLKGDWHIELGIDDRASEELHKDSPIKEIATEIKVNGLKIKYFEKENSNDSGPWRARFFCNKKLVSLFYISDPKTMPKSWNHKPPPPLSFMVQNSRCEMTKKIKQWK